MSNVVTISQEDWDMLLMLRRSIKYYRSNYEPKYDDALSKTNSLYTTALERVA